MTFDNLAKQLHNKATRGESISAEERSLLGDWYALRDRAEGETLGLATDEETLTTLQAQREPFSQHFLRFDDGTLHPLTPTGAFTLFCAD